MFDNKIIKEYFPGAEGLMIQPMLIHASTSAQLEKACESGDYFGEIKKDGAFYQFVKGAEGQNYLFGRTVSKKNGLLTEKSANIPHIIDAFDSLPNKTILIGEIYYPRKTSKAVVSIMGCLPEKAIDRQENEYGYVQYYIHDILMYDGVDLIAGKANNELRYKILNKIFHLHNLGESGFVELAEAWDDNLLYRIKSALDSGEEGMVIKKKDAFYEPGRRPLSNLKAKTTDYIDAIITGFLPPTVVYSGKDIQNWEYWLDQETLTKLPIGLHFGEDGVVAVTKAHYLGWKNSRVEIGAYDEEGQMILIGIIHSGISDELKQKMTEHPEDYLNKVCEIQCMSKDPMECTVRHGFLKSIRPDKDPIDCRIKDIF